MSTAQTQSRIDQMARKYAAALEGYLREGGEAALQHAYELGRGCLAEGRSILEMVTLHHQALQAVVGTPSRLQPETIKKAGEFFTECMSAFEMTHRAFGEANEALRRVNETLEEQARFIARELHDQSGQLLAAVHIKLDEVTCDLPPETKARVKGVKELLDQVETQLRSLSHELRPTVLDDLGLVAALESLAGRIARRTGLRIAVHPYNGSRLPARVEVALYRIVQEALNNVSKHAHAKSAKIRLRKTGKTLACSIEDDGRGFNPKIPKDPHHRGLGLVGIQERLQALRGELTIDSAPGEGTKLRITIPLEE